jgi:hypothetical protein
METYGVKMKVVLPWLVHWARRAGTKDFYSAHYKIYFFSRFKRFHFMFPHLSATWAGQSCLVACLLIFISGKTHKEPAIKTSYRT